MSIWSNSLQVNLPLETVYYAGAKCRSNQNEVRQYVRDADIKNLTMGNTLETMYEADGRPRHVNACDCAMPIYIRQDRTSLKHKPAKPEVPGNMY